MLIRTVTLLTVRGLVFVFCLMVGPNNIGSFSCEIESDELLGPEDRR